MTKVKELLPIGSVVQLKKAEKKLAIVGVLMNNNGTKYDYIAVLHPEGYIDQQHMYLFNHNDIDNVLFLGYMNAEFQVFRGTLAKATEQTNL